jgi:hypothetical protein
MQRIVTEVGGEASKDCGAPLRCRNACPRTSRRPTDETPEYPGLPVGGESSKVLEHQGAALRRSTARGTRVLQTAT